jgi:hypothetical protein
MDKRRNEQKKYNEKVSLYNREIKMKSIVDVSNDLIKNMKFPKHIINKNTTPNDVITGYIKQLRKQNMIHNHGKEKRYTCF